jgi:hypothetical protein
MVSPKGLLNGTQRHVDTTFRLKIAICYRNKRHFPLRDTCPYELGMLMKRPN